MLKIDRSKLWVEPPPPPPLENLKVTYLTKLLADLQTYREETERKIAAGRKAAECAKILEDLPFANIEKPEEGTAKAIKSATKTNRDLLRRLFHPPPSPPRSPEEELAYLESRHLKTLVAQRTLRFDLQAAYSEAPVYPDEEEDESE